MCRLRRTARSLTVRDHRGRVDRCRLRRAGDRFSMSHARRCGPCPRATCRHEAVTDLVDPDAPSAHELAAAIAAGELSPVDAVDRGARPRRTTCSRRSTASRRSGTTRRCAAAARGGGGRGRVATRSACCTACPSPSRTPRRWPGTARRSGRTRSSTGCPDRDAYVVTALRRAGADHHRPDDVAGVRPHARHRQPAVGHDAQPARPRPHARRVLRRQRGGGGVGVRAARRGQRHGRLGAHPGRVERRGRAQAGARADPDGRAARPVRLDLPPRAARPLRRRRPPVPRRHAGPRRRRHHVDPRPARPRRARSTATSRGMRLGLSTTLGCWAVDPEIAAAVEAAAERLEAAGADRRRRRPGLPPEDGAAWMTLWAVFMAAYFGDVLEEFRDRMDPEVVRPDRDRPAGRRRPTTSASSSSAPTCGSGCARSSPTTTRCCARRWPQPPCPAAKADGPPRQPREHRRLRSPPT